MDSDADGNTKTRTPAAGYALPPITDPADYVYNSGGQRAVKDGTSDKIFHYDLAGQLIAETDGAGALIKAYVWLHGKPLAQIGVLGEIYYYHNDHLGTPQKMTNQGRAVVWAADYLPFGQATVTVDTVENNLRFAGQYYDSETGLHYNYFRYYDPKLGRYLRADPIGLLGGVNLYQYASANPINVIDPSGLLIIYLHGTFASGSTVGPNTSQAYQTMFNDNNTVNFGWSGGNSRSARNAAASELSQFIRMNRILNPNEPITVVAHSHGGNVAIGATNLGAHIDNLVTLGTPLRADYSPNMGNIDHWYNVYSESDMVQVIGGNEWESGCAAAARRHPNAFNIEVAWDSGPFQTHSDLRGTVGARALQQALLGVTP